MKFRGTQSGAKTLSQFSWAGLTVSPRLCLFQDGEAGGDGNLDAVSTKGGEDRCAFCLVM